MLELAKPSVPALCRPPPTSVLQIRACRCSNWQNRAFLLLVDYPLPRFCKFEHMSARIGRTELPHFCLTTHHRIFPFLAPPPPQSSRSCPTTTSVLPPHCCPATHHRVFPFLAPPPPRFCQFEQLRARIGKTESSRSWPTTPISVLPIRAHKCSNWQNRARPCSSTPSFLPIRARKCLNWQNRASRACSTAHHPHFCQFKRASARIAKIEPLPLSTPSPLRFADSSTVCLNSRNCEPQF